jgi:hypothetical protein
MIEWLDEGLSKGQFILFCIGLFIGWNMDTAFIYLIAKVRGEQ